MPVLELEKKVPFAFFIGILNALVAEAGILGLGIFLWTLYSALRRR